MQRIIHGRNRRVAFPNESYYCYNSVILSGGVGREANGAGVEGPGLADQVIKCQGILAAFVRRHSGDTLPL